MPLWAVRSPALGGWGGRPASRGADPSTIARRVPLAPLPAHPASPLAPSPWSCVAACAEPLALLAERFDRPVPSCCSILHLRSPSHHGYPAPFVLQVLIDRNDFDSYFWINLLLTFFAFIPGIIHALWAICYRSPSYAPAYALYSPLTRPNDIV